MQTWEYLTEATQVSPLAQRGQEGWRLVAIDGGLMFFERPMAEPATASAVERMHETLSAMLAHFRSQAEPEAPAAAEVPAVETAPDEHEEAPAAANAEAPHDGFSAMSQRADEIAQDTPPVEAELQPEHAGA